jgi:hypothetical protein
MSEPAKISEEYLTIEQLATRLKLDPKAVQDLLTEVLLEMTKEYLTIGELAKRLSLEEKTIKNKMAGGIFQKGIHYFSPKGLGPVLSGVQSRRGLNAPTHNQTPEFQ